MPEDPVRDPTDLLAQAAVEAGEVPAHVAEWVEAGAVPDPTYMPEGVETAASRAWGWQITDLGAAAWAMRKLAHARAEIDRVLARYTREMGVLNDWRVRACAAHQNTADFMEERLEAWAVREREANPKVATLRTPAGEVRTSKPGTPWKVEVADKDALLGWALANGRDDLIRPTLATVSAIRDAVEVREKDGSPAVVDLESGEIIPGLVAEATMITATVKPDMPA